MKNQILDPDSPTSNRIQCPVVDINHISSSGICEVWESNFEEEMKNLMRLAEKFNVIAVVNSIVIKDT